MNGGLVFAEHCAEEGKAAVLHPGPLWENTRPPGPLLWATRPRTLSRRSLLPGALTPFATYRAECSEGVRWGNLLHPDLSGRTPGSQARPGGSGEGQGQPPPLLPPEQLLPLETKQEAAPVHCEQVLRPCQGDPLLPLPRLRPVCGTTPSEARAFEGCCRFRAQEALVLEVPTRKKGHPWGMWVWVVRPYY